ncbi:ACL012Wp [Eremothecium gossypii ATCC 10895]|uniref:Coenzyme Q-binding protein COQ10, mitochondrial n=1 Tax=Eremothecium gossypii (strain ATCC 10895 / CBS 109.51 / FGSC 9923 / NRRL Y-1056) TaxID=284811 RepID=COQ10_EREGS|nr:ACL012Wp [Eremothecium gossypii ATCC 10895]Q75CC1.1 RecName: Full=Coenzyme Q-binding protein COQ10, mitochondrial; Flags: Precursor [Eremothecium gossypii ATCC 10895]AAS51216.1 ACL012Wp [Eremothecium gossypii ATCC 10895]AEY95507.1 FACL012Wp [Eremothecium gossypii FDAG1]
MLRCLISRPQLLPTRLPLATPSCVSRRTFLGFTGGDTKEQRYILKRVFNAPLHYVYPAVSEVSLYKLFIPYCTDSFVNKRRPGDNMPTEAGLRVGFQQYDETFVCRVDCTTLPGNQRSVVAESLAHHLFETLHTQWLLSPHPTRPDASVVELILRFKFKSQLYNSVSSIFGTRVTQVVMKAFEKRVFQLRKEAMDRPPTGDAGH